MNPNVERLEALLARVQHNRAKPRVVAQGVAAPAPVATPAPAPEVSFTKAPAAPAAPAPAPKPPVVTAAPVANPLADLPPSLDATVDDAVIVAETKARVAPPPPSDMPVLELEPHSPKADVRTSVVDLDDPGTEPLPDPDILIDEPAPSTKVVEATAAPKRSESQSQLAAAVQIAADEEPRTDPPARSPVLAQAPAPVAAKPAEIGPIPVVPAPLAASSGPVVKVVVPQSAPAAISFGELIHRSIALRPR